MTERSKRTWTDSKRFAVASSSLLRSHWCLHSRDGKVRPSPRSHPSTISVVMQRANGRVLCDLRANGRLTLPTLVRLPDSFCAVDTEEDTCDYHPSGRFVTKRSVGEM